MKKLLIVAALAWSTVQAAEYRGSYALYDYTSKSYVAQQDRNQVRPMASITKLFTAITVLNSGQSLDQLVKVTGRSRGHVPLNSWITRRDLLRSMLISSDNLAAESLAHAYPGGFDQFIVAANHHIQSLGLINTRIEDSTGLSQANVTTVSELVVFLDSIRNQVIIRSIAAERTALFKVPRGKRTIKISVRNTNPDLFVYDNILITKTGFTNPAGRCLLMLVDRRHQEYAVVILGQPTVKTRSHLVNVLLNVDLDIIDPIPTINTPVNFAPFLPPQ